jgi:hypothetical protein
MLRWAEADEAKWARLIGSIFQNVKLGPLVLKSTNLPYLMMDYANDPNHQNIRFQIPSDRLRFKISTLPKRFEFVIPIEALRGELAACDKNVPENHAGPLKLGEDIEQTIALNEEAKIRLSFERKQEEEDKLSRFCDQFEFPFTEIKKLVEGDQIRANEIVRHLLHKRLIPRAELDWARDNGAYDLIRRYVNEHLYVPNGECVNVKVQRNGTNYNVGWSIRALHEYEPERGRSDVPETTSRILKFKRGDQSIVQYYAEKLDAVIGSDAIVCSAPSHLMNKWGHCLIETVEYLGSRRNRTSYPKLLRRNKDTQKRSQRGSDRSLGTNLNTIDVTNKTAIEDRPVVVIDDVTTTGNTMSACSKLLWSAGCNCVGAIALGHTILDPPPFKALGRSEFLDDELPF